MKKCISLIIASLIFFGCAAPSSYGSFQSRENAFNDTDVTLSEKVLSISEEGYQNISPINNRFMNQRLAYEEVAAASDASSTVMPTGELEVTTRILVVFSLE